MEKTPVANRPHIAIYGKTNAGKSSLLNAIIGQDVSIVSSIEGTTTDPVFKTMELLPFGPVVFIDTAGLNDESALGKLRMDRSHKMLHRTDLAMHIIDSKDYSLPEFEKSLAHYRRFNIPYLCIINKSDLLNEEERNHLKETFNNPYFVSSLEASSIFNLKNVLIEKLNEQEADPPIVGDLLPYGSTVVLVVPIDSEAPKGRIILPQVQVIRDCLDHGIKSMVVRDTELDETLKELNYKVDLVITDSQAFKEVAKIVPDHIKLTSFSILFARHKGDLEELSSAAYALQELGDNAKVLISESCTHNHSHEDIGRYKIPKLLGRVLKKEFDFSFKMGHDFPSSIEGYDLIIHCGSCMINSKTMKTRIQIAKEKDIPITNYGVVLAYLNGILDRSLEIFA